MSNIRRRFEVWLGKQNWYWTLLGWNWKRKRRKRFERMTGQDD